MNRRSKIFFSTLIAILFCFVQNAAAFVVVIDAGHGGHDPGALGKLTKEKDLNLSVSLKLGKLIEDNISDVKVFYTRKTDVFLSLQERANFVNKHNADLFICIHANSADNKAIKGAETFTLGVDKMQSNLDVAMRENSVILLEDDYQTRYQGFNPNSVESYIMFEFLQDRYIDKSLQFASLVQEQFSDKLHRADRGVRQAGFWVLHKSACPSVLIEMGFVSNVEEEKYLKSETGKDEISKAIYDAFCTYKKQLDKKAQNAANDNSGTSIDTKDNQNTSKKDESTKKDETTAIKDNSTAKKDNSTAKKDNSTAKKDDSAAKKDNTSTKQSASPRPVFRVQIFSVSAPLKAGDPTFKGLKNCKYTKDGKYYKYTYGEDTDYKKIAAVRDEVKKKFGDCFIVAFLGNKQITVKEALKM